MLRITLVLILAVSILGFSPNAPAFTQNRCRLSIPSSTRTLTLRMADDKADNEEPQSMVSSSARFDAAQQTPKNVVRDVDKDQQWRDTEIGANTQFDIFNFSSIFVVVPLIFLLDDFLHFLPEEWKII